VKTLVAVAVLLLGSPAVAAPPPISPLLPVPGISQAQKASIIESGMHYLREALGKARLDPAKLSRPELQCMAARFVTGGARALLLLEELVAAKLEGNLSPAQAQGMRDAIAYLEKLEDDWCNGQGGSSVRVEQAISSWRAANAPQAKSLIERAKEAIRELDAKPSDQWTAAEWALVGAIITAAVASELIPLPI
jgi:hypothetical protein